MAPLPANSTAVLFIDYEDAFASHQFQVRCTAVAGLDIARQSVTNFLNALQPIRSAQWVLTGARFRETGSNITLPVEQPAMAAGSAATPVAEQAPRFVSWIGRGATSGRRVRVYLYGLTIGLQPDYRFTPSENATLNAARAALQAASANGAFITAGGDTPTWYTYANLGYNAYWQRERRKNSV